MFRQARYSRADTDDISHPATKFSPKTNQNTTPSTGRGRVNSIVFYCIPLHVDTEPLNNNNNDENNLIE